MSSKHSSKFRVFFSNWTGITGVIVVAFGFILGTALLLVDLSSGFHNPYLGMFVYMVVPTVILIGLFLMAFGAFRTIKKRKREGHESPLPSVDLNDARVLRRFIFVNVILLVFLAVSGVAAYQAFHFTESVGFCGTTCHQVMNPEYETYLNSPHANVKCVRCHIGPGAEWFVKAKLSGLHQVLAVLKNSYHRPIKTPLENLRPASETCNECHWPKKFFGAVLRTWTYYSPDEKHSPWTIKMLLKVGGGDPTHGPVWGIHWHMYEENKIEYVSRNGKRQEIPWIKVTDQHGDVTIYRSEEDEITDEELAGMEKRHMDCMDCHNRPTHHILSPNKAMDQAMLLGVIDKNLPNLKVNAIDLLTGEYETKPEAFKAIEEGLRDEYSDYEKIDDLVYQIQQIYTRNFFPEMKIDWRVYPDHIGHKISAGCFRCHDNKHVTEDGKRLTHDCTVCHDIIAQGPGEGENLENVSSGSLEFKHPEDIDGEWKTENCHMCHEGVPM